MNEITVNGLEEGDTIENVGFSAYQSWTATDCNNVSYSLITTYYTDPNTGNIRVETTKANVK